LIIHACFDADFRKKSFSTIFPSISVFQCEGSGRSFLAFGQVWLKRSGDSSERTQPSRMLMWQCASGRASDPFGQVPHRLYIVLSALAAAFHLFFSCFFVFLLRFSRWILHIFYFFCPLVPFISFQSIFTSSFALFLVVINCLYLGICFEINNVLCEYILCWD
jgi:hypothetical protein